MSTDYRTGGLQMRSYGSDSIRVMAFTGKETNAFIRQRLVLQLLEALIARTAAAPQANAGQSQVTKALQRYSNQPEHRTAIPNEGNIDSEFTGPTYKFLGAIKGIHHPAGRPLASIRNFSVQRLLRKHRNVWSIF